MSYLDEPIKYLIGYAEYVQECINNKEIPLSYEKWKQIVEM